MLRKFSVHMCSAEIVGALTLYIYLCKNVWPFSRLCMFTSIWLLICTCILVQRSLWHSSAKNDSEAPDVFIVYFPDNERHVRDIRKFVQYLCKHGINATADMFEADKYASDRGFYYYSKLIQSEFVFVVCSPLFLASYEHEIHQSETSGMVEVKCFNCAG